jgi:hypothetical protein
MTVRGLTAEQVQEIIGQLESDNFFQHYVSSPEELVYSTTIVESVEKKRKELEATPWWSEKTPAQQASFLEGYITQEESDRLKAEYGHDSGYDWCIDNWGTKWDVCDSEASIGADNVVNAFFNTAWSPPIEGLRLVSEKFPEATFELGYQEEGCDFCGAAQFINGAVNESIGKPVSELGDEWKLKNHPEMVGDEDQEDELHELWCDAAYEYVSEYVDSLMNFTPVDPALYEQKRAKEKEQMEAIHAAIQDMFSKEKVSSNV